MQPEDEALGVQLLAQRLGLGDNSEHIASFTFR